MHVRNIYATKKPDFAELSKFHAEFGRLVKRHGDGSCTVDFQNAEAVRLLAIALLAKDFDIHVDLTVDRLVPAVPQRLNYLHWVEDLVARDGHIPTGPTTRGIDIGTGASAIFPLLGARLNGWSWLATDIDELSLQYARSNVSRNNLTGLIAVLEVKADDYLQAPLSTDSTRHLSYDFCMCNPPFFSSESEANGLQRTNRRPSPHAAATGCSVEKVASGGEVDFVKAIIADSVQLRERVRWYTTMLGKKSSLPPLLAHLKHYDCAVTTTQFVQGKTVRWGLAWTFESLQFTPQRMIASKTSNRRKRKRPFQFVVPSREAPKQKDLCQSTAEALLGYLKALEIVMCESSWSPTSCVFRCKAFKDTWTHHRRRVRQVRRDLVSGATVSPSACTFNAANTSNPLGAMVAEDTKSDSSHVCMAGVAGSHAPQPSALLANEQKNMPDGMTGKECVTSDKTSLECTNMASVGQSSAAVCHADTAASPDCTVAASTTKVTTLATSLPSAECPPLLSFTVTVSGSDDNQSAVSFECEDPSEREVLHRVFIHLQNQFQIIEPTCVQHHQPSTTEASSTDIQPP